MVEELFVEELERWVVTFEVRELDWTMRRINVLPRGGRLGVRPRLH